MSNCTLQIEENVELSEKALEVLYHSAWQGTLDESEVVFLLKDQKPMTYLLHQDTSGEYEYWLSHKKRDGEIHHRHFTIRELPDGWFFMNARAPISEDLETFIQGALAQNS